MHRLSSLEKEETLRKLGIDGGSEVMCVRRPSEHSEAWDWNPDALRVFPSLPEREQLADDIRASASRYRRRRRTVELAVGVAKARETKFGDMHLRLNFGNRKWT